jgi:hypothetical protein
MYTLLTSLGYNTLSEATLGLPVGADRVVLRCERSTFLSQHSERRMPARDNGG